jgi:hypothetical protein
VLVTGAACYPVLVTGAACYPVLVTGAACYPVLVTGAACYPVLVTSAACYPALVTGVACYQPNCYLHLLVSSTPTSAPTHRAIRLRIFQDGVDPFGSDYIQCSDVKAQSRLVRDCSLGSLLIATRCNPWYSRRVYAAPSTHVELSSVQRELLDRKIRDSKSVADLTSLDGVLTM